MIKTIALCIVVILGGMIIIQNFIKMYLEKKVEEKRERKQTDRSQ